MASRNLVFASRASELCGVEAFTRLLARHWGARLAVLEAKPRTLLALLRDTDHVVFNFPIVAWKRLLLAPVLAALLARLMGRSVSVVLHEWLALDWKRRLVLAPVVLLATRICFSAPEIAGEFDTSPLARWATKDRPILPIPPNIVPLGEALPSAQSQALALERSRGRLVLGQFGSIYPKKQSSVVLEVAAHLVERGHDVAVVFAGSFIRGMDTVERDFFALAEKLGIRDRVSVTGYIGSEAELTAILRQVDVFCYAFAEGLTARRGSVLAAALSGRPVVVNAPLAKDGLDHHPLFQHLVETGAIRLVDNPAETAALAAAVLVAHTHPVRPIDASAEIASLWAQIVKSVAHWDR